MNKDDMVYQGYKLPLYPTKEQKDKLEVIFRDCQFEKWFYYSYK